MDNDVIRLLGLTSPDKNPATLSHAQERLSRFSENIKRDKVSVSRDYDFIRLCRELERDKGFTDEILKFLDSTKSKKDSLPWSQGIYYYTDLIENLDYFGVDRKSMRGNPHYERALRYLDEILLRGIKVSPLTCKSDQDCADLIPKKGAHAGITYLFSGKKAKGDNVEGLMRRLLDVKKRALEDKGYLENFFILPQSRCQSNPPISDDGEFLPDAEVKRKVRLIWMVDLIIMLLMMEYQSPWQTALMLKDWYAAGKDPHKELHPLLTQKASMYPYYWVLDGSHYDAHLPPWLMYHVRAVQKSHYNLTEQQSILYDRLSDVLIHKKIYDGNVIRTIHGGMGSGFASTMSDDSTMGSVEVATALFAHGFNENEFTFTVEGDDFMIHSTRPITEELKKSIISYLYHNFGYVINDSKTNFGRFSEMPPEFLSLYWYPEGPRRNCRIIIAKVMSPERDRSSRKRKLNRRDYELLFYSLCQLYPIDMNKYYRVDEFLRSVHFEAGDIRKAIGTGVLPGSVEYYYQYLEGA